MLRAYAKYMRQTGVSFSQSYIEETLTRYPDIAQLLFTLFEQRLDPAGKQDAKLQAKLHEQLAAKLDQVANLDDDRIIRRYVEMIDATLRTNYYQLDKAGNIKPYISFKLAPPASPTCRCRCPSSRSSSTRRGWKGCTCAGARWPVAVCAGLIARRTSVPKCWGW